MSSINAIQLCLLCQGFFVASIDEITNNSSEHHIDQFPRFFHVNCLLMFYSIYCNKCFFRKNNRVSYCNRSLVAPLLPKFFMCLAESRKNFSILSCIRVLDLVLNFSSDIMQENGIQVFLSLCFDDYIFLGSWNELLLSVFQVLD